jgi:hypothetical protein
MLSLHSICRPNNLTDFERITAAIILIDVVKCAVEAVLQLLLSPSHPHDLSIYSAFH